jgi:hypothetical protein
LFARLGAAISTFNHQFGVEGYQEQPDPAGEKEPVEVAPAKEPAAKAESEAKPSPRKKGR